MRAGGRRAWHAGDVVLGRRDRHQFALDRHRDRQSRGTNSAIRDFPLRQIAAVISLCKSIITRRGPIAPTASSAHSDVAPARKQDPGEKFPWGLLSESGIGHWVRPAPIKSTAPTLAPGERGELVIRLQRALRGYGYGIEETGSYDEATRAVVAAFQRHFRPARVDGLVDASTMLTLRALLETRPAPLA